MSQNELLDYLAITTGAKDYDRKRIPFIETVREICSPFIVFDEPGHGDQTDGDNPLLKLCHKTVEEFFLQNPDDIDLTSEKLRRYFVKGGQANENVGLNCLTYLQYDRYQQADIVLRLDSMLRKPVPREHAFLAYAATFWAQHLECVSPTPEIYQAVHRFLRSSAFRVCLAVQTRVARYLFGRYIGCNSGSQYQMGIRGSRMRGDDSFGLPLPRWLDRYSHEGLLLDRSVWYFVDEWREVLVSCTDGLPSCLPLRLCEPSCQLDPLEKPRQFRVAHISLHLPEARSVGGCHLLDVVFSGKTPWADVLFQDRSQGGRLKHLRIPLFTPKKELTSKKKVTLREFDNAPVIGDFQDWTMSLTRLGGDSEDLEAWKVDSETLSFGRVNHTSIKHYEEPLGIAAGPLRSGRGKWDVKSAQEVAGLTGPLLFVHMAWEPHHEFSGQEWQGKLGPLPKAETDKSDDDTGSSDDEDDDYSSDDSASDDNGSDTSSTGAPQSTIESSDGTSTTDRACCMLVVPSGGKPHWIPWSTSQQIWPRVLVAPHPTLPLVVMTHTAGQLEVVDVAAHGTKTTKHLPEPPGPQETCEACVRGSWPILSWT